MSRKLTDEEVTLLRAANIPVPESHEELCRMLEEAERTGETLSIEEAVREIRSRLTQKRAKDLDRELTDEEVKLLRAANISVPESDEELMEILAAAKRRGGRTSLDETIKEVQESLARKPRASKSA
jgi:hypothetical protein